MSEAPGTPAPDPPTLGFLHTAHLHVATFDALTQVHAPGVTVRHRVEPTLLTRAMSGQDVRADVEAALRVLADGGATTIVCTCVTIGSLAENTDVPGCTVLRVDRPAAAEAVRLGRHILMVFALDSARATGVELVTQEAQAALASGVRVTPLLVDGAWSAFTSGDVSRYDDEVEAAVRTAQAEHAADLVLLAQASMAPVAPRLADLGVPVLAIPRLAVEAALRALSGASGS